MEIKNPGSKKFTVRLKNQKVKVELSWVVHPGSNVICFHLEALQPDGRLLDFPWDVPLKRHEDFREAVLKGVVRGAFLPPPDWPVEIRSSVWFRIGGWWVKEL